jgi:U3 small nucleolar ribonucleoprotein protein IMP3
MEDFITWVDSSKIRRTIAKYNDKLDDSKLVGNVTNLAATLKKLPPTDDYRIDTTKSLLRKLYLAGLIDTEKSLLKAQSLTVSAFCRRRLPVVMVRLKMSENLKEATTFVEQGQIRMGPNVVTDPAFLVTRNMEDFITWVDSSKIRRTIAKYNDKLDDFDLLGA